MWIFKKIQIVAGVLLLIATLVNTSTTYPERLTISPSISEVIRYVNDSFIAICNAHKGSQVRWHDPKGYELQKTKGRIHIEDRGNGSSALVFKQMLTDDRGNYACTIKNGTVKKGFSLLVSQPITFMDTPLIQTTLENTEIVLKCEASGDPVPVISWSFNGVPIKLEGKTNNNYKKLADGLLIRIVTRADDGEYTCKATQVTISNQQEHTIILKVEHTPQLVSRKNGTNDTNQDIYGFIGGVVNLTCQAEAFPQANFTWFKDAERVQNTNDSRIHNDEYNASTLELTILSSSTFGKYTCRVVNNRGSVSAELILLEHPKPRKPLSFELSGTNGETLEFSVELPPQTETSKITRYRFQYITTANFNQHKSWAKSKQIDLHSRNDNAYLLIHLTPSTKYMVRVASGNVAGYSEFTEAREFSTGEKLSNASSILKSIISDLTLFYTTFLYLIVRIIDF